MRHFRTGMLNKFLVIGLATLLSGCGAPTPPPVARSAKNEIEAALAAMNSGKALAEKSKCKLSADEYARALEEINNGESFAVGTELIQLNNLRAEARNKKIDMETRADARALQKQNAIAVAEPVVVVPDIDATQIKIDADKISLENKQREDLLKLMQSNKAPKVDDESGIKAVASAAPKAAAGMAAKNAAVAAAAKEQKPVKKAAKAAKSANAKNK